MNDLEGAGVARRVTYDVIAEREGEWWKFSIPALDTGGQARTLPEVDTEARGVISAWLGLPMGDVAAATIVRIGAAGKVGVIATRWSGGWELELDGGGVTQVHHLAEAAGQVRDYLDTVDPDVDHTRVQVNVRIEGED